MHPAKLCRFSGGDPFSRFYVDFSARFTSRARWLRRRLRDPYPVYQGMYERANPSLSAIPRGEAPTSPVQQREITVMRVKDLRRTIDYLETRTDLHPQKRGYYGAGLGGNYIPFLAVESRFLATISVEGCILLGDFPRPEADSLNFAPRMKLPFRMINGRFDSICPVKSAQEPFFRWMGTAVKDKKHVLFDTGHFALAQKRRAVAAIPGWLDLYLGTVD